MRRKAGNRCIAGQEIFMNFSGRIRRKKDGVLSDEWISFKAGESGVILNARKSGLAYIYLVKLDNGGEFETRRHHFEIAKKK